MVLKRGERRVGKLVTGKIRWGGRKTGQYPPLAGDLHSPKVNLGKDIGWKMKASMIGIVFLKSFNGSLT